MKTFGFASFGLFLLTVGCGTSSETKSATGAAVGFPKVQAVLATRCLGCHSPANPKGGVALDSYANVMKGGRDGSLVKAGDPAGSELVAVMKGAEGHKKMPPMGQPATSEEIKTVEDWIRAGAKAD